jgi:subtilisin family serine protease
VNIRLTLNSAPLAGRTGRGVRIAIIDSGIVAGHPHVGAVAGGVSLLNASDEQDYGDRLGHGTAVAAAIREKAPDAELLAVRIFDRELRATGELLARALRWSVQQDAQLINLSLGTPNEARRALLSEALEQAAKRGARVVAAAEHNGRAMFPGALAGAVGVLLEADCERDELVVRNSSPRAMRIGASGYPRPIPGVSPDRNVSGLSFAVANTTGFLARVIEKDDFGSWLANLNA